MKNKLNSFKNLINFGGAFFAFQCYVRRILSFKLYEDFIFQKLKKFFQPIINKYQELEEENLESNKDIPHKVWTLWWQGEEEAPEIIKVCIESQRNAFANVNAEFVVLTENNWRDYIELPEYILNKVKNGNITLTHFSDIIRAELLKQFGGIWIDATVYCTKPIEIDLFKNGFYTVKNVAASAYLTKRRWTGFLLGDYPNSLLFRFMSKAFAYYWSRNDHLAAYLLIDYTMAIAYEQFTNVQKSIDNVPLSNPDIWTMLRSLNDAYESDIWNHLIKKTTFMKLSYKTEFNGGELKEETDDGDITYWGHIKNSMI